MNLQIASNFSIFAKIFETFSAEISTVSRAARSTMPSASPAVPAPVPVPESRPPAGPGTAPRAAPLPPPSNEVGLKVHHRDAIGRLKPAVHHALQQNVSSPPMPVIIPGIHQHREAVLRAAVVRPDAFPPPAGMPKNAARRNDVHSRRLLRRQLGPSRSSSTCSGTSGFLQIQILQDQDGWRCPAPPV